MPADRHELLEQRTRYDPADVESRVFERWQEARIFHPEPAGTAAENYSIAVPPPNVTGALHMGHALNGSIQDVLHPASRACAASAPSGSTEPTTPGSPPSARSRRRSGRRARPRRSSAATRSSSASGTGAASTARASPSSSRRSGASLDYEDERFTMDDDYQRAVAYVFVRLHEKGLVYRDNYMVNWDPGPAHGDLRPRGRAARGQGHALLDRLPARVRLGVDHGRDGAPRDDAGRHRDRGEPERRALLAPDRRDGDPAARGPAAAGDRRRARRPRVRHRGAQDHARSRPVGLRDRPPPRARGGDGDRRGRPHHRGRAGALPRAWTSTPRAPQSWPSCASRGWCRRPSRTCTTCRTRTARAAASSR